MRYVRWLLSCGLLLSIALGQPETVPNVVITSTPLAGAAYTARKPIFFPPTAPVLGAPLAPQPVFDRRFVAPSSLAPYVGEWFYPALSTLLAERQLRGKLAERLEAYRRARTEAEEALLQKLNEFAASPAEAWPKLLRAFGEEQAGRLDRLERDAEALRVESIAAGTGWDQLRHVPVRRKAGVNASNRAAIAPTLLAAAYYRADLRPAQRQMLVEAVIASGAADPGPYVPVFLTGDRRPLFLPPHGARVAIPRQAEPAVARVVREFEELQERLRNQVVDTVIRFDLEPGRGWRAAVAEQARELDELERRAERCRELFAGGGFDGWPAPAVQWPEAFQRQLEQHSRQRAALLAARTARMQRLREETLAYAPGADAKHFAVHSVPLELSTPGNTLYINYVNIYGTPAAGPSGDTILLRLREAMETMDREQKSAHAALAAEEAELGAEAARIMQVGERMIPSQALAVAVQALEQAEVQPRYTLCRIAVLQPGLSAAHRRLLFARALRELALALPGGEFQPRDQ